ncbi:OLC1v1027017C1 [Oldenlandia corymbosa var. corymbosa]|uniref:OLC1v1027017C1 n=1 Tax=Oldenlandia corymbosa var. corymbosa TaxID=529605 RepID=A0AAV1C8S0_OLDCO|nr:OLC1v1027017C1 [Oldenlandia corymbosa var. corymbosa]
MERSSLVMKLGDGPDSYFRNSKWQESALGKAKSLLADGILGSLQVPKDGQVFAIADFGCSVGPNTFSCIDIIIDAVKHKYQTEEVDPVPEFQAFFNDQVDNDFNTLFKRLPHDRGYMAAGVPGSFHGRLFPKSSIHLMTTNMSVHWLSKVPEAAREPAGGALFNKARITYARSSEPITQAFRDQFYSDMKTFLNARSQELAPGGLLAILVPGRPEGTSPSESIQIQLLECLGDALADMVKEGIISEDLIDSFNIPCFMPMASEMEEIVASSGTNFSIKTLAELHIPTDVRNSKAELQVVTSYTRAITDCVFSQHFSPQVVDEIFTRFPDKLQNLFKDPRFAQVDRWESLFTLLARV